MAEAVFCRGEPRPEEQNFASLQIENVVAAAVHDPARPGAA
jgi:hypothetical protein